LLAPSMARCGSAAQGSGGGAGAARSGSRRRAALRWKVRDLRRLVPGGEEASAGALLARMTDYIASSRLIQVRQWWLGAAARAWRRHGKIDLRGRQARKSQL
jgi:hypothetical protein